MWQYTDGALGPEPHTVTGVAERPGQVQGTESELRALWESAYAAPDRHSAGMKRLRAIDIRA